MVQKQTTNQEGEKDAAESNYQEGEKEAAESKEVVDNKESGTINKAGGPSVKEKREDSSEWSGVKWLSSGKQRDGSPYSSIRLMNP